MKTRTKFDLNNTLTAALHFTSCRRKSTKQKQESSVSLKSNSLPTSDSFPQYSKLFPIMSESDDLLELEQIQLKQLQLETKILSKIPIFKSSQESNVTEFLTPADDTFSKLKYSDHIRLKKIEEKLDASLQSWFTNFKKYGIFTWNGFKNELQNCLSSTSSSSSNTIIDSKTYETETRHQSNFDKTALLLDVLRKDILHFSSDGNARQWFLHIDAKFSELQLLFQDRIEILPYFFIGETIIWYSLNKNKIRCYTDFCQLFALEYFPKEYSIDCCISVEQKNNSSLPSPLVVNEHFVHHPTGGANVKTTSADCHSVTSSDSKNVLSSTSILSLTISKALIDRFVKDPIKFYGGKDNVITWLDVIEQQFKIMNLSESDKLNLIHICLKGEAHQWYKQNKEQFTSWSIFVTDITKSFTSSLQRDLAFKKLKQYHQTLHQSVTQYYSEMIKLMKQTDPQMNKSTKVQYLMNGLRPSLSTETRRNYPTTTQNFLERAKIAEELTALNTTNTSDSIIDDDFTSPASLLHSNSSNSTSRNNSNIYSRNSNSDNHHYNNINLSNSSNQPRYINRIYDQTPYNSHKGIELSHLSNTGTSIQSSQNSQQPQQHYNNSHRNNFQQYQQSSFQQCFKCGSLAHQARHCHHFEKRSQ
ncbi:unnamed protein product [Rotaria sp. Silwood2]|nr:unnamed protein product [Rotaria sp. Silwood2]CAF3010758.1 unnamed protein product [Rotaria sp. Silwood2]CAF3292154.1 unnamed protein product [Rotaria sp. Silwood2]CAF4373279.1 unnamed protein product [Rotaria sp. Silwood2]CAF4395044.1 unnamed protein product [Rotaria sp. Silwood2]